MKSLTLVLIIIYIAGAVTLDEAIQTALSSRSDIIASRNSLQSSIQEGRAASLWFLPKISAGLTYIHSADVQQLDIPGMGSISMGSEYMSEAGINVDVPLYVPQAVAGSNLSGIATEMAEASLAVSEQNTVEEVTAVFYGALLAEELAVVAEEALSIAEEAYSVSRIKYESGMISRLDLLQSEVAWENRKPGVIETRMAAENARTALAFAMGLEIREVVPEGYLEEPLPLGIPASFEEAETHMRENNPDLDIASDLREMGSSQVRMARAEFMPSLLFRTSYSFQAMRDDWHFTDTDYDRDLSFMISLQIPLFDGYSDIAGYKSAQMSKLTSETNAFALENAVSFSLQQAWSSLEATRERVNATDYTLLQAEEVVEIAQVSFETGVISQLEMDQALLALTMARTNRAAALFSLRVAEASVLRVCGALDWYSKDNTLTQHKIQE